LTGKSAYATQPFPTLRAKADDLNLDSEHSRLFFDSLRSSSSVIDDLADFMLDQIESNEWSKKAPLV
jgi:hypothetical protein